MNSKLLIRISACLIFLQLLGHTYGHFIWDSRPDDSKMQEVIDTMKSHSGNFMGATKSMADYYTGYSLMIFFLYVMTIIFLWQISILKDQEVKLLPKFLYPIAFTYSILSIILFLHFFLLPACLSALASILIFISIRLKNG